MPNPAETHRLVASLTADEITHARRAAILVAKLGKEVGQDTSIAIELNAFPTAHLKREEGHVSVAFRGDPKAAQAVFAAARHLYDPNLLPKQRVTEARQAALDTLRRK